MEKIELTKDGILIESAYFDAEATLFSGQCFRARRVQDGFSGASDTFEVISCDKKCTLISFSKTGICKNPQNGLRPLPVKTLIITDSPEYFFNYFDLKKDYGAVIASLSRFSELACDLEKGRGIHILRQPLFETIIGFIISANNNISRIKGIIQRLCIRYGEYKDGFYAFPTPIALRDVRAADYLALGAGYRAEYLESTVKSLLTLDILESLPQADYKGAVKILLGLKGVGRKVADCICLFALGHTECYPVDTWIQRRDGLPPCEARRAAAERYGDLAGYAQQYKFYAAIGKRS